MKLMKIKSSACRLGLLLLIAFMAACQPKTVNVQPPDINYGQDVCDRCGMIISEARYASAIQLINGDFLKFDDAGEMFAFQNDHPDIDVLSWWVHDYSTEQWIPGETAYYVSSDTLHTPMGMGIVCFAEQANAQQFAAEQGGKVYSFIEIQKVSTSHSMDG